MKKTFLIAAATIVTFLVFSSTSFAGVKIEIETKNVAKGAHSTHGSMYIDGENVSVTPDRQRADSQLIFRGDRNVMYVVDHTQKQYTEISKKTMEAMAGQLNMAMQAMRAMESQMANMPPAQRKMVKDMMKQQMGTTGQSQEKLAAPSFTKTSESKTVNGYPCTKYLFTRGSEKITEAWVTDWSNVPDGQQASKAFKAMSRLSSELLSALKNTPVTNSIPNPYAHFEEIDGFPIVTSTFQNGSLQMEMILTGITQQSVKASRFEPPAGYKENNIAMTGRAPELH